MLRAIVGLRFKWVMVVGLCVVNPVFALSNSPTATTQREVSPAEAALIARVERELNPSGTLRYAKELLDIEALTRRCIEPCKVTDEQRKELWNSMLAGFEKSLMAEEVRQNLGERGSVKFLRAVDQNGERGLLFRTYGESGICYVTYVVAQGKDGQPCIVDYFSSSTGELLSESSRDAMQSQLKASLSKQARPQILSTTLVAMQSAMSEGDFGAAVLVYKSAPEEVRKNRVVMLNWARAASRLSTEEFVAATDAMIKDRPNDVTALILSMYALAFQKRTDEALKAVDRVDAIYHDPFLDVVRAAAEERRENWPAMVRFAKGALKAEPKSYHAALFLVAGALQLKDYKLVGEGLNQLAFEAGVPLADLREVQEYAGFVASSEFEGWEKHYKARAATRPATEPPG